MSKPINLNRVRKQRARDTARQQADENAVNFGRTKAQKQVEAFDSARAGSALDGAKLDGSDADRSETQGADAPEPKTQVADNGNAISNKAEREPDR
ncbi:DUF4169 family protein [Candidatus Halocynthiibacter alkanivorans]|uniref:DUF4169 family protein n=1 Tax=Candidatus Halocynthiibacter alkanivorans TaxID=2267619 RepID=UPI000DF32FA7